MSISPPKKVFRSRISVLLVVFILAVFIPVSVPVFQNKDCLGMCVLSGVFFLIIVLFTGIRYVISGRKLILKICFIPGWTVDIADIRSIERSYNPLSSPAAALKRLHVSFNGKTKCPDMLISPDKEQKFIHELKYINPHIYVNIPEKKGKGYLWDWDI